MLKENEEVYFFVGNKIHKGVVYTSFDCNETTYYSILSPTYGVHTQIEGAFYKSKDDMIKSLFADEKNYV